MDSVKQKKTQMVIQTQDQIDPEGETETDHTCITCNRQVRGRQGGVLCGFCDVWFHIGCEKVKKDEYEQLKELVDKAHWFCRQCSGQFKSVKRDYHALREENKALKQDNQTLKNKLEEIEKKLETIQVQIVKDIKEQVMEEIKEEDRERRKCNLVIYNLQETTTTKKDSPQETEDLEKVLCLTLFEQEIKVTNTEIVSVRRFGRPRQHVDDDRSETSETRSSEAQGEPKPRPRPLLVQLTDPKTKWTILTVKI